MRPSGIVCTDGLVFAVCADAATNSRPVGVCRVPVPPSVGTPCLDRPPFSQCGPDASALRCVATGAAGAEVFGQPASTCRAPTAIGDACAVAGDTVCVAANATLPAAQVCVAGACAASGAMVAGLGDGCDGSTRCVDGAECLFRTPPGAPTCIVPRVAAGGACGPFAECDADAGLACGDGGVCVAAVPVARGGVCAPRLGVAACAGGGAVQGGDDPRDGGGLVQCVTDNEPGVPPGAGRCVWLCAAGTPCAGEWDRCVGLGGWPAALVDGVCVDGVAVGGACTNDGECERGVTPVALPPSTVACRPADGTGGGDGTAVSADTPGVCALTAAAGEACGGTPAAQCAAGLACTGGVCGARPVQPGGACAVTADCAVVGGAAAVCATGRGGGRTCRQWRGPFAGCASAADTCWAPELACADAPGGGATCVNAPWAAARVGAYCRDTATDCGGGAGGGEGGLFCDGPPSPPGARRCKRRGEAGEECSSFGAPQLRLCVDGTQCRYSRPTRSFTCQVVEGAGTSAGGD
ncbi:hypothetical protein I4F81_000781 [Pyropia yezoensis]|uniref:Uncharacterized protein n=1 Tax=Pyropia yezoensis TaxID=2788 RepID=A0ACC3BK95_PYRYE|nr:hypothetical protein I4F81_000781 [Neopyropia yezoensis]